MTHRTGQSILEYLIVFTCIVAAIAVGIKLTYSDTMKANFQKTADYLKVETKKLPDSLPK